jgi:hypothetical protein
MVERADRIDVVLQKGVAESPVPELDEGRRADVHPLANGIGVEVVVALDGDEGDFVAVAAHDPVLDGFSGAPGAVGADAIHGLRGEIDLGVKVALAFEVLAKVVRAFDEQIAVDGLLFEHGDQLLELAP